MARKMTLGGKAPQSGNKVSHSHRKTKRKWMPNIQTKAFYSVALGRVVRMTISTQGIRTVDKHGGLDNYLLQADPAALSGNMRRLQQQVAQRAA